MKNALQGAQMLFVAFGALVLVPLLTGLDPNVALFGAGIGTLIFQVITRRSVPIFLASSFAFIAPIMFGVQTWGIGATMGGLMAAGVVYVMMGGLIKVRGVGFIHKLLPPVVVGPVIMVIGLGLAPVAVNMALGKTGDGAVQLVDADAALWDLSDFTDCHHCYQCICQRLPKTVCLFLAVSLLVTSLAWFTVLLTLAR